MAQPVRNDRPRLVLAGRRSASWESKCTHVAAGGAGAGQQHATAVAVASVALAWQDRHAAPSTAVQRGTSRVTYRARGSVAEPPLGTGPARAGRGSRGRTLRSEVLSLDPRAKHRHRVPLTVFGNSRTGLALSPARMSMGHYGEENLASPPKSGARTAAREPAKRERGWPDEPKCARFRPVRRCRGKSTGSTAQGLICCNRASKPNVLRWISRSIQPGRCRRGGDTTGGQIAKPAEFSMSCMTPMRFAVAYGSDHGPNRRVSIRWTRREVRYRARANVRVGRIRFGWALRG